MDPIMSLSPKSHHNNEPVETIATLERAVSKLKAQNQSLAYERNQLRTLIDNLPDRVYLKNAQSQFLNANRELIKQLGKQRLDEILGKTDFDFFDKEFAQAYFNDEQEIVRSGQAIEKEEPTIGRDGQASYLHTSKSPVFGSDGQVTAIVGIGKDVTKLQEAQRIQCMQAETLDEVNELLSQKNEYLEKTLEKLRTTQKQLLEAEKMASLGVLIAGIAHEINNPINFIYAGVNSLLKDLDDIRPVISVIGDLSPDTPNLADKISQIKTLQEQNDFDGAFSALCETIEDIRIGATRINEIITSLGRFSRLDKEEYNYTDLHEDIDGVLVLLKNKYKNRITIERDFDNRLPHIECFPGKLNQVLMNLLSNAIDAIEDQGTIHIRTHMDDEHITVHIKDSGVGMSPEVIEKAFDPFFTTKPVGKGVGLGLSISYSIIREHHGSIRIESQPGQGSEFILTLPILQPDNDE